MAKNEVPSELQKEVEATIALENEVKEKIAELKTAQDKINATWAFVEQKMIDNDIKSIKGDWGSLTIAERTSFDIDKEILPRKFWKRVPDEKKIRDTYKLEGKPPKGALPKIKQYLTKRIK